MSGERQRSNSRSRTSRPTTPLRPSSRSSFRDSARHAGSGDAPFPLNAFEPAFAELSDSMADLEANMMHFQLMHESLSRFTESFASFLYGLNMNAFCVDFPEGPVAESFRRERPTKQDQPVPTNPPSRGDDGEMTFMQVTHPELLTTDTSFVENPSTTTKSSKFATPTPDTRQSRPPSTRGSSVRGGRGNTRGTARGRPSGLVRPRARGLGTR
ncbi:DASH complex subunit Dam1-domain-containing protein [Mariannaea sp. PMI_226]|nr:DASH complex subunit Dam1-domain-containing protein [Mariannaea sp. PMI_226]